LLMSLKKRGRRRFDRASAQFSGEGCREICM
jgi:hypothetical protein